MGHTCSNLNGELLFIWGGTDASVANSPTNNTDLWIYETLTGYFRYRCCTGECPPYMSGATSSIIEQKMYVFGGHSIVSETWLNGLHCLDLENFVWKDLGSNAKGEPTQPIRADKCVSWSFEGKFYVFGGYGWSQTEHLLQLEDRQKDLQLTPDYRWPKYGWNNQFVEFDPRDNTWRWPAYTGKCPSARAAHAGALLGSKYYLFGGRDSRERLNDLYTLDMKTLEWSQIAVFSFDPAHRITQPIRHLLDEDEEDEQESNVDITENDDIDMVVEEIQVEAEEQFTPSPSEQSFQHQHRPLSATSSSTVSFNDADEDEDLPLEYPPPPHLFERLSLCSRRSASSSSNITNIDCANEPTTTSELQLVAQDVLEDNSSQNQSLQRNEQAPPQNVMDQPSEQPQVDVDMNLVIPEKEETLPRPIGRSFCSFTPISDDELLLYGGVSSSDENLHDCWIFNVKHNSWTKQDLRNNKYPRLWHTGTRTRNNEVIIIGGSSSDRVDEVCSDVLTISKEPKSLKKLALDSVSKSIKMRSIHKIHQLPSTICKLIKLRKQAMALTMRRTNASRSTTMSSRMT